MNNLSNERLKEIRDCDTSISFAESEAMARELLALREAQSKKVSFDDLRDAVAEMTGGMPLEWSSSEKGYHAVPFMNFNSLARIVDKFYAAPQLPAVPMQPLEIDDHGTLRFRQNEIVRKLLDHGTGTGCGLNEMALDEYSAEDRMQLAQLIGYSLSGYGELSYVTDESYDRAIAAAPNPDPTVKK